MRVYVCVSPLHAAGFGLKSYLNLGFDLRSRVI